MIGKKIRVAFFADNLIGDFDGATRTMFQILKRIPKDRFEFFFICGVGPTNLFGYECMVIPAVTIPVNVNYKIAVPQFSITGMRTKLNVFAPDVIHIATPSMLGNFALKYAERNALPVISIYHTHFTSYIDYYCKHAPFLIDPVKQMIASTLKNFYNQCNKAYVPSESMLSELTEMGIDGSRMEIWKRGIDRTLFCPAKRNKDKLKELTGNDFPTILFASRLVWEKNLETLFRIYDLLKIRFPQHNFIVAGDGLARKASERRMKDAIFTGKVNHETLSVLYASSDIFLFPSVSETYGNVVLEAMASGVPCVLANGGGSKDFIIQGINGFKCLPYSEADYVERIIQLLSNPDLWNQISIAGFDYSMQFDWEQLVRRYFDDVEKMAAQSEANVLIG